MSYNSRPATLREVLQFFVEEIDGMGIHNDPIRNLGLPGCWEKCNDWTLCELTEPEFMHLLIPDGTNMLIKEKGLSSMEASSKDTTIKYLNRLNRNQKISPLILRSYILTNERKDSSFSIEDGSHRAIAAKIYFENHKYIPVKAYIRGNK